MKTYQLQLINCNNHNIEISRYLQILTRIEKEDADRIVSNVPVVLYDNLDEECAGYFEEALDYYQAEYEIQPMSEECDIPKFPSRQIIVLGRVMEYFGQRSDFVQLAKKYDFSRKIQLSQTPFAAKDGLNKEQAVKLCQEFTNIGMRAQIVRSKKKPVPIELQLINCNNHNIEISRYLQILTRIEKEDADRIVSNVPVVLYDNLDEECAGYFEEALDYYQAEYEIQPMSEECDIPKFPSRQIIVLGRVMEYFGQRSDFVQLAKKYDFSRKIQLSQTPFAAKDGLNKEQAVKLCQEFTNIGMRAQIVRSKKKPVPIEEKKKSFWNII